MTTSSKIIVTAQPNYLPAQSDPREQKFTWSYQVTITNESDETIQLLNRFWRIMDTSGRVEEVAGPGVVGLQPLIKPGKHFTYTSFCQLATPHGVMAGHYEVQNLEEEQFKVEIPKFILSAPLSITKTYHTQMH